MPSIAEPSARLPAPLTSLVGRADEVEAVAALLRRQFFVYRDLFEWIDEPFQPPPQLLPMAEQIPLSWSSNLDSRMATSTREPQPRA